MVELPPYVFEKGFRGLLPSQNHNNNFDELFVIRLFVRIKETTKDIILQFTAYEREIYHCVE
jgi:hypothetical protein